MLAKRVHCDHNIDTCSDRKLLQQQYIGHMHVQYKSAVHKIITKSAYYDNYIDFQHR